VTEQAIDLVVCPECGAGNAPHERRCWLCGGPIDSASKSRQASAGLNAAGHAVLTVSLTVIAATYLLICIGVWQEAPGLAVGLLAIVLPPMIATAIASFRGRRRGKPLGLGEKTLKFMIWFSIVLGLIGLTAVAAAVAFCIWCFAELARKS
jgi:hypothetical protein